MFDFEFLLSPIFYNESLMKTPNYAKYGVYNFNSPVILFEWIYLNEHSSENDSVNANTK